MVEDLRSVRRWLVLLGLIALAAGAVAAYALIQADESQDEAAEKSRVVQLERTLAGRIAQVDKRLARTSEEIDNQERRLRRAGEEADVAQLDRRLRRVENDVTDAVDAAADTGQALDRFERRLDALDRRVRRRR